MAELVTVSNQLELDELLKNNHKVLVDFSAPAWCVPCKQLEPHYKMAAMASDDAVFAFVDTDLAEPDLVSNYGIRGVPTLKLFVDGQYVKDVKGRTAVAIINEIKE